MPIGQDDAGNAGQSQDSAEISQSREQDDEVQYQRQ